MSGALQTITRWFRRRAEDVEDIAKGGRTVSAEPPGVRGDDDRETSTNAQLEGTADEPWPDRD